ncbi:LLM class flavin-dependent oxidoreductase [Paenibacillus illinoisensis]|uniref:LLM class flavin-dependent oxidoreductase n=1 Tax=Paenibacillus illinoisensis TaxID=59845 RepID=UPI003D294A7F
MALRWSVLDRSPTNEGENSSTGIQNTIKLAVKAEQLGYHRFWVSEHHGSELLVGSSPEVLISHLISTTKRIRVGSGGVMLQHYSPYKVAENFNLLSVLAPGRVDLGVGRGPGGLPASTQALSPAIHLEPRPFNEKLDHLNRYLQSQPIEGLFAQPVPVVPPELYLLGTGVTSAELAAHQGLPFVYAHFINGDEQTLKESLSIYRTTFNFFSGRTPELILSLSVLFAKTEEEAQRQADDKKTFKVHFESGKTVSIYSFELAKRLGEQANEPYTIEPVSASIIYGTQESVLRKINEISQRYNIQEVMILPAAHEFEQRLQAYEWLSVGIPQQ